MIKIIFTLLAVFFSIALVSQNKMTGFYYVKEKSDSTKLLSGKRDTVWVDTTAIVTIRDFTRVKMKKANYGYGIEIVLTKNAAELFRVATAKWVQKKIAIVVNNEVISAPIVVTEIGGGKVILTNGSFSKEDMEAIKASLAGEMKKNKN